MHTFFLGHAHIFYVERERERERGRERCSAVQFFALFLNGTTNCVSAIFATPP